MDFETTLAKWRDRIPQSTLEYTNLLSLLQDMTGGKLKGMAARIAAKNVSWTIFFCNSA
jgi:hypothetical protein